MQNYFGKMSKMDVAQEAIIKDHMLAIADTELDVVNRYRDMKVFNKKDAGASNSGSDDEMSRRSLIVCDDYHLQIGSPSQPQPAPSSNGKALPYILAGALGLGSLGLGGWALNKVLKDPPAVVSTPNINTDTNTIIKALPGE